MVGRNRGLIVVGLVVAIACGAGAGTACALRSFGNNGGRTIASRVTTLTIREPRGENTIRCETRVEGIFYFSGAIPKRAGADAGILDQFESRNCRSNFGTAATVTALLERNNPRDITYHSFTGTLPNITEMLFEWELAILIDIEPWAGCLYEGTVPIGTAGRAAPGMYRIEKITFLSIGRLPLFAELRRGFLQCSAWIILQAEFTGGEALAVENILV